MELAAVPAAQAPAALMLGGLVLAGLAATLGAGAFRPFRIVDVTA